MLNYRKIGSVSVLTITAALFTSCGMMDEMKDIAKDTRDHVKISVEEIRGTKTSQSYAFHYENMMRGTVPAEREDSAKVVLLKAPAERLQGIIGTPSSQLAKAAVRVELNDRMVELPNVSIVGAIDPKLEIAPITADLHQILEGAVLITLRGLRDLAVTYGKDETQAQSIRESLSRMIVVSTAVLGAVKIENLHQVVFERGVRQQMVAVEKQKRAVRWMEEAAHALRFSSTRINAMRGLVRQRMGDALIAKK